MNNLKKFSTESEYASATLNYPAVSWVTGTDTVHFDKTSLVANNKVKLAFTADACCEGKTFGVIGSTALSSLNGITVNGEPLTPGSSDASISLAANTDYLIEYELKDGVTNVNDWFALNPVLGCSSMNIKYDLLFPSQVTTVTGLHDGGGIINNLLLEETTPPSVTFNTSSYPNVYVPDSAVNTYKSAEGWSSIVEHIFPISDYEGDIPV